MIGLLLREALDRLRVRLNMYLVFIFTRKKTKPAYLLWTCYGLVSDTANYVDMSR